MQHLVGRHLPDLNLRANSHAEVNPANINGRVVYFCYPYTGKPNVPNPPGWDNIKGAHGSTPQALAFATLQPHFSNRGIRIFGVSLLSEAWIADFADRNMLPYDLLSDEKGQFSGALNLPRFTAGDQQFLSRLTLICNNAKIENVIYPVIDPESNAAEVLAMLQLT